MSGNVVHVHDFLLTLLSLERPRPLGGVFLIFDKALLSTVRSIEGLFLLINGIGKGDR